MRFRLLGPVEAEAGGRLLSLPRRRERCLLGVLLLEANRVVPVDRLGELLWDGDPPARARSIIYRLVYRVRVTLAATGQPGTRLAFDGGGYRLLVDPESVDAHQFRSLLRAATAAATPAEQVERLRTALDLWRGQPLAGTATDWLRDRLFADLREQRLTAAEEFASISLALRREREALPELARLVTAHPGREALVALQMQALYRCGRRAEALAAFASARSYLADDLGLDPGPQLRQLHEAILRDELADQAGPAPADPQPRVSPPVLTNLVGSDPVTPRQLPRAPEGFVGRAAEVATLDRLLSAAAGPNQPALLVTITGSAGIGKTALALHWAHRVAARFLDGQLYLDLRGFDSRQPPTPVTQAIRALLDSLQVPVRQLPTSLDGQIGLYRSLLSGRQLLIVLDNARDAEQVRPLLPAAPGCAAVVTSRDQLTELVWAEGAHPLRLEVLTDQEAEQFLTNRLGIDRLSATEPQTVTDLIRLSARLPLALALVAARAATHPGFPLAALAEELASTGANPDLHPAFACSYEALTSPAARQFRLLGLHPSPEITAPAAASLASVTTRRARQSLGQLAQANLLTEPIPGRFALPDLLRSYAAGLAADQVPPSRRLAACRRLLDHYLHTAYTAAERYAPHQFRLTPPMPAPQVVVTPLTTRPQALAWFTAECRNLLAAIDYAAQHGFDSHAWQLAHYLTAYLFHQGHWHDQVAAFSTALPAAERLENPTAQALCHRGLADGHAILGSHDRARAHYDRALHLFQATGDTRRKAATHQNLAWLAGLRGDLREQLRQSRLAYRLLRAGASSAELANALNAIGWSQLRLGDLAAGIGHCRQALTIHERIGDPLGTATTLDSIGYAHHQRGDYQEAIACYQRALTLLDDLDDRHHRGETLDRLGDSYHALQHAKRAAELWWEALDIYTELGSPDADRVRAKLAGAGQA